MDSRFTSAIDTLRLSLDAHRFARAGGLMTDLDGTAVLEQDGRIYLPPAVEAGMKRIHDAGRPVVVNTLRFPLSVMRVFAAEWWRVTHDPLPLVSLKGSLVGRVVRSTTGDMAFEEWHAETLAANEILEVLDGVRGIESAGGDELLLFYYPRDWQKGERIWTADADRVAAVAARYRSASAVTSSSLDELRDALLAQPICMIFLLITRANDRLMAYQHTQQSSFVTRQGVSKRSGAHVIAHHIGFDLEASVGAGDAPTDDFLSDVGIALIVGSNSVDYRGVHQTIRLAGIEQLGQLLGSIGDHLA